MLVSEASTYEITTAGPAWSCAAAPVSTNTPPPMTPPTPSRSRSAAVRHFFIDASDAASAASALFRRVARLPSAPHASRKDIIPPSARGDSGRIMPIPTTRRAGASLGSAKGGSRCERKAPENTKTDASSTSITRLLHPDPFVRLRLRLRHALGGRSRVSIIYMHSFSINSKSAVTTALPARRRRAPLRVSRAPLCSTPALEVSQPSPCTPRGACDLRRGTCPRS